MPLILIIEDDPSICSNMELILQMEGFDVRTASDGTTGIAKAREKRPDLVLCDILMPEMDGHSTLEFMRREPSLVHIPFIFVTALCERADMRRGMSKGADDYLTKPFSAEELLAAVTGRLQRIETFRPRGVQGCPTEEQTLLLRQISAREREVLQLVGHGATSKEIAERLGISLRTAEVHRSNLMRKLNAPNAATLARWAVIAETKDQPVTDTPPQPARRPIK